VLCFVFPFNNAWLLFWFGLVLVWVTGLIRYPWLALTCNPPSLASEVLTGVSQSAWTCLHFLCLECFSLLPYFICHGAILVSVWEVFSTLSLLLPLAAQQIAYHPRPWFVKCTFIFSIILVYFLAWFLQVLWDGKYALLSLNFHFYILYKIY
jgi:hypothetical protein